MIERMVLLSLLFPPAISLAAEPPAVPSGPVCVKASRGTDYNVRAISQNDVLIRNAVGDRRPLRLSTTCIHLWPDSIVAVRAFTNCVHMGDDVFARTIDGRTEACKVAKVAPFEEGGIQPPYK